MKSDPKTEAVVIAVMSQLIEAFAKRDADSVLSLLAPDPEVVFIGTGADEKCIGLAEIKAEFERTFTQSEEASIESGWYYVSQAGLAAGAASPFYHSET